MTGPLNLVDLIQEYVTEERQGSGKLYPSSVGGCPRRQMYRVLGYEQSHPMDHRTRWKLQRFGWYEELVKSALRAKLGARALVVQHQIHHPIWSARTDVEVGGDTIIEVKSISQAAIRNPDLPYHHHVLQAHCYACLLEPPPRQVLLLYISRWRDRGHGWRTDEIPELRQFDVTPTDIDKEACRALMDELERWYNARELPPRPFASPDEHAWECSQEYKGERAASCSYFAHCWPQHCDDWGDYRP